MQFFNNVRRLNILFTFLIYCFPILHISLAENTTSNDQETSQETIVLWWTPFTGEPGAVKTCNQHYPCYFTENREFIDDSPETRVVVLFYGSDFKPVNVPLPRKNQLWGLLHEESPKNNPILCHKPAISLFNFTATFRRESSFPLTLFSLRNAEDLTDLTYFVSTKQKNLLQKEKGLAPIVYVQSACDAPSERDLYVEELMKYIQIDSYGACLHNKDLPLDLQNPMESMTNPEFLNLTAQYKFTLAFENAVCKDYVSEKLWRPLQLGSVPIYLGSPQVTDWTPNPKSVIEVQDFSTVEDLARFVKRLNEDDALYEEYLKHKLVKRISNQRLLKALESKTWSHGGDERASFVDQFECYVCQKAHEIMKMEQLGFKPTRYVASVQHYGCPVPVNPITKRENPNNWWVDHWRKTEIEALVLNEFVSAGRNFSATEFHDHVIQRLSYH